MQFNNRLAEVMAELDAERRREPKQREARVSFLLEQGGRIVELIVDVTPEKPPARAGEMPPVRTDVGWFDVRIVQ